MTEIRARPSAERCCQGVNLCFCPEWRPGLPGWAQIPGRSGCIEAGPGFRALPADGCRVITYDRRRCGTSSQPAAGCDCGTFAARIRTVRDVRCAAFRSLR